MLSCNSIFAFLCFALVSSQIRNPVSKQSEIVSGNVSVDELAMDLKETPFQDLIDYATWTQYVCIHLLRAGDIISLEKAISRLNSIASQMDEDDAHTIRDSYWKLQSYVIEWRKFFPDAQYHRSGQRNLSCSESDNYLEKMPKALRPTDGEIIIKNLLTGHYGKAKKQLKSLVDQQDYMEFDSRLKYVMVTVGLIQWDAMCPSSFLPLWSPEWSLPVNEKISALIRAKQLLRQIKDSGKINDPLKILPYRPFSRLPVVDTRIMANLGLDVSGKFNEPSLQNDPAEREILKVATSYAQGEYCLARDLLKEGIKLYPSGNLKKDLESTLKRLGEKCTHKEQEATYRSFCTRGKSAAFPIAEASPKGEEVLIHERMFWTRLAAGDCEFATFNLNELRRLVPLSVLVKHPYLERRFKYMDEKLSTCQKTPNLYVNTFGHQLMDDLRLGSFDKALERFNANLKGENNTLIKKVWRDALLTSKFPKTIFAPCLGNTLIIGDEEKDSAIKDRLMSILNGSPDSPCNQSDPYKRDLCNLQWAKAYYIADNTKKTHEYVNDVVLTPELMSEAQGIRACTKLCSGNMPRDACRATSSYERLLPSMKNLPHNTIGANLARQICEDKEAGIRDNFYVIYGPMPRTITSIIHNYMSESLPQPVTCPKMHNASESLINLKTSSLALSPKIGFRMPLKPSSEIFCGNTRSLDSLYKHMVALKSTATCSKKLEPKQSSSGQEKNRDLESIGDLLERHPFLEEKMSVKNEDKKLPVNPEINSNLLPILEKLKVDCEGSEITNLAS